MLMDLDKEFLKPHAIDIESLSKVKHRLYVVGRFNRKKVSPEMPPEVYLFTNRPKSELAEQYVKLFTKNFNLNFESFIRALQPAIAEEVVPSQRDKGIPAVIQYMPSQDGTEEGSVVIDMWNFFFWRAAANSDQPAFNESPSGIARDILRDGEVDPGRGIYKLIRKNLNVFCTFQPRTSQLVEAFSALLDSTSKLNGLPAHAAGGALPGGFLENLIDFVYSPDLTADFSLDGVDLTKGLWEDLRKNEKSRKSLIKVVNTFRNVLVGAADQHADMRVIDGVTVYQKAKDLLGKKQDLAKEFAQSRDAYNALSQIVRSKVLLSMVLEWVFKAHYDLDPVKGLADAEDKDQMVEKLSLGKISHPDVAVPVKRATTEERDKFKKSLADSFERLMLAVIAGDDKVENAMRDLPAEIRGVAEIMRADEDRRQMLQRMAMGSGDPGPFIESQKTVLLDVLIPVLYQTPILGLYDLRMLFRREVQTAYLTAVTLDDKYQGVVRQVAEEFLPTFLKNIDSESRKIKNSGSMQSELLRAYVERIASKDMADRIIEAQEAIQRAMTVLENTTVKPGETRGASHVAPIFDDKVGTARRTEPSRRNIDAIGKIAVEAAVESLDAKAAEKVREEVTVSEPGKTAALSTAANSRVDSPVMAGERKEQAAMASAGAQSPRAGAPDATVESASKTGSIADATPSDGILDGVKAMVADFLETNPNQPRKDILEAIRVKAQDDTKISGKAKDAVKSFHQILSLIYQRYRENQEKSSFVGRVDRMTLANLMLVNQEALGLGKACSNLYAMLLDVVENMNPENPDPKTFIRDFSITRYFDNDVLEKDEQERSGITDLRKTLEFQAHQSLENTVSFISELRGIKYLMDAVGKDSHAEVIVVNATADEFLAWIVHDNLSGELGTGQRMQSAFIRGGSAQVTACPGLVYLTDSAFQSSGDKGSWLESLKSTQLSEGNLRLVLPPFCLSTGVRDPQAAWIAEARNLAEIASPTGAGAQAVPAPVVIVGPSPYLNKPGDVFGTYLPAGYLFAVHFLCQPEQKVRNTGVKETDKGRSRVIGAGIGEMQHTLDLVVWGADLKDTYAFAVDFYLYILLSVLATAKNDKGSVGNLLPTAEKFFPYFFGRGMTGMKENCWKTTAALNRALIGSAENFSFENEIGPLTAVMLNYRGAELRISDIQWFKEALVKADLPRFAN